MAGASNPMNVQSPVGSNVSQTSANLFNQAAAGPNIGQFMNPYTSMVTGQAMQDLNRQRQMATNDIGASATRAGAFGGSRHGVAEALTNTGFAQQGANMFGNLQQQGFNTALGAAQNQQGIQSGLAGQGFGFGQQINQQQAQQGALQQALNQALIDAGRGQYQGFTGSPTAALGPLMGALGAAPVPQGQTQTQSSRPGLFDFITAGASIFCWVAREVYGEEDHRWQEFRVFMFAAAPEWLFNLYSKHGEAFAKRVARTPMLKRILRPIMNRARHSIGFEG